MLPTRQPCLKSSISTAVQRISVRNRYFEITSQGTQNKDKHSLTDTMKNSQYRVTFGIEIEFVFIFHEKLILAELLNSVEDLLRKPGGNFREGREHADQLRRAIRKVISDEDRREMRQAPFQYSDTRPHYLAWGVWLDWDTADAAIKTNAKPGMLLRTYGREPCQVAKEVLRSGPQTMALEYWEPEYPDDMAIDVHLGPGKPSDWTNWHLIPEFVVEAHTDNALKAYLEKYKRCSDRDGSESPKGKERPYERDSDGEERPAKRFKSTPDGTPSPTRIWVTAATQSQVHTSSPYQQQGLSPNLELPTTSFQTHDSNQENRAPSHTSHLAAPGQLPSTSFGSNASSNQPATLPATPNSQQLTSSFQIYESASEGQSSTGTGSAQVHQPELDASGEENRTPERPSHSPLSSIEEQDEENQSILRPDVQQEDPLLPDLLQSLLYQQNQEQRNQIHQSLQARNPLMQLHPQHVPPSQIPQTHPLDLLDQEHEGRNNSAQPSLRVSDHSASQQSHQTSLTPTPLYCTHLTISPGQITNVSLGRDSDATQDDPNLPPLLNSQTGNSVSPTNRFYSLSLTPAPPGLKVNECKSLLSHPYRRPFNPANPLQGTPTAWNSSPAFSAPAAPPSMK